MSALFNKWVFKFDFSLLNIRIFFLPKKYLGTYITKSINTHLCNFSIYSLICKDLKIFLYFTHFTISLFFLHQTIQYIWYIEDSNWFSSPNSKSSFLAPILLQPIPKFVPWNSQLTNFFFSFFRFFLFIFRQKGRKGEREGEKHQCVVASHMPPTRDLACNPGMCPDW